MGLLCFYDFETSGLPLFDQPSDDPRQPHIVQAAALLVDSDTRSTVASLSLVVRPDGWIIPNDVARVHGVTTDAAERIGIPESLVVQAIYELWSRADIRIAHNESFDARIMRIGLKRFGYGDYRADAWTAAPAICTAKLATPIMQLPPTQRMLAAGRRHPKTPNLAEAHRHFLGRDFDGPAHDALTDAKACAAIYWAIRDRGADRPPAATRRPTSPARPIALDSDLAFLNA